MIGNAKRAFPELITPAEAVALSVKYGTAEAGARAIDIANEYQRQTEGERDRRFREYWTLAAIYDAGRMQGIREERARRKAR